MNNAKLPYFPEDVGLVHDGESKELDLKEGQCVSIFNTSLTFLEPSRIGD